MKPIPESKLCMRHGLYDMGNVEGLCGVTGGRPIFSIMRPLDISCRRCCAQANEYCDVVDGRGVRVKAEFAMHAERIEDARWKFVIQGKQL